MRPTKPLFKRLKTRIHFTTKDVGKGFYRGNKVGSLGAHTSHGGYVIDYRKARHFVVPNMTNTDLTPYVSSGISESQYLPTDPQGARYDKVDSLRYFKWWFEMNRAEADAFKNREIEQGYFGPDEHGDTYLDEPEIGHQAPPNSEVQEAPHLVQQAEQSSHDQQIPRP